MFRTHSIGQDSHDHAMNPELQRLLHQRQEAWIAASNIILHWKQLNAAFAKLEMACE